MQVGPGCCCLIALGFLSCGGTSGSSSVNVTDPASIKATPAGVSTLVFMDLELVRPDHLTGASGLPAGVNASLGVTTLTFTNRQAANGGVINGTIKVAPVVSGGTTTFTETFDLTVTPAAPVTGVTPVWTWFYRGVQTVAVTTTHATLDIESGALTATYTDNTVTPAGVKAYQISTPTPMTMDWSNSSSISLAGEYQVSLPAVETVSVTIQPALVWNANGSCGYPTSGTLTLDLASATGVSASITATFKSTCGAVAIGVANLNLGQ